MTDVTYDKQAPCHDVTNDTEEIPHVGVSLLSARWLTAFKWMAPSVPVPK